MKELAEFRVAEEFAPRLFAENEGKRLGVSIRKVELETTDPRFTQVGELQKSIDATLDKSFFHGSNLRRKYTDEELESAKCFHLIVSSYFEPPGEECGTVYDESMACPECGTGALQTSDLRLDLRKVPKNKDIACSIADEVIISQRFAECLIDAGLSGFELWPVRHKARYEDDPIDLHQVPAGCELLRRAEAVGAPHPSGNFWVWLNRAENRELSNQATSEYAALKSEEFRSKGKPLPTWYQFIVISNQAEIAPPTRVGINPFNEDSNRGMPMLSR